MVPQHGVFGEEHGLKEGSGAGAEFMWVLDPIDGTKSFITGEVCLCGEGRGTGEGESARAFGGRLSGTRVMKGRVWEGEREGSRWGDMAGRGGKEASSRQGIWRF